MSGLDRTTFRLTDNLAHTLQSVEVILSTNIGSRVMRRPFGGGVAELLGRAMQPRLFALIQQLVGTAIDLWEPRLSVRRVSFAGSADEVRLGSATIVIEVDYRPRGHLSDFAVERNLSFSVNFAGGAASASVL
ncbi:GPW/gp25 family protein [Roseibium salinum]|uniref:GPW/gp25 family protein n=1 Tax=Roseibium salinum TaxID=1604349 RepID=A0ABT3R0B4_9HYPH|nr:GPW/gp25 family protein [Roseibium sp. DSM 29163]MCX2722612.1 GPW/gp25 family protein [Roseibium sp. DSM 29163]MDN3719428.1 GPW/gp25 family protein [Roseibium salinum]